MADEEAIQRKRERLAIVTYEYFWKACPKLTTRWRQAMLAVSPSALQDLAVELQGLVLVTKRANQELRKAHVRGMNGDVPPGRQIPAARSHVAGVCREPAR